MGCATPLLYQEGCGCAIKKRCEATAAAQTGWSGLPKCFGMRFLQEVPFPTTPSAPLKEASLLLLDVASTPPIIRRGVANPIHSSLINEISAVIDRTYNRSRSD